MERKNTHRTIEEWKWLIDKYQRRRETKGHGCAMADFKINHPLAWEI
jgi:hypothetical protein